MIRKKTLKLDKKLNKELKPDDKLNNFEIYDVQLEIDEIVYFDLCDLKKHLEDGIINNNYGENDNMPVLEIQSLPLTYNLLFVILFPFLLLIIKILHKKILILEARVEQMESEKRQPYWKKILSGQSCSFFVNIDSIQLFHTLHDKIAL